jgi:hypothetical protein
VERQLSHSELLQLLGLLELFSLQVDTEELKAMLEILSPAG